MQRRPLYHPLVAIVLVLSFGLTCRLLLLTYDGDSLYLDPVALLAWAGTSFLVAFSAASWVRRPSLASTTLLFAAVGFLWVDFIRHGDVLRQYWHDSDAAVDFFLRYFSANYCGFDVGSSLCALTMFIVHKHPLVMTLLAALFLGALAVQFIQWLRSNSQAG